MSSCKYHRPPAHPAKPRTAPIRKILARSFIVILQLQWTQFRWCSSVRAKPRRPLPPPLRNVTSRESTSKNTRGGHVCSAPVPDGGAHVGKGRPERGQRAAG